MAWILKDEQDRAIIAEIEAQSDRGAMIIASSMMEARLEKLMALRLDPNIDEDQWGRMFRGSGPVASFSAKIDLGLFLQLYPIEVHRMLHKLRDIRNKAAHRTEAISFETQSIKDRCNNLITDLPDVVTASMAHHMALIRVARFIPPPTPIKVLYGDYEADFYSLRGDPEGTKEKFLTVIKAALFHFHQVSEIFVKLQIALPPSPGKSA